MVNSILALTAGLAATASAFTCTGNYFSFYNRNGASLSYQRLDPALDPGTESAHLHSFDGGNALAATMDFADATSSTCTTARIKPDKSLYWRPTLFWNGNNTGFYRVPEQYSKIYYKFGDGNNWANVTGFPKDFSMIAGSNLKRSDSASPANVQWGCHQADGGADIYANGFPKGFTSCNYGFAVQITFPSCWNGQSMDPKNPNNHMAYPDANNGIGIENCPTTHRAARFPTIFIEFWWDVSSFKGHYSANDVPWVLSNGDPTGFGFHADFLNGWETGVLDKAVAETGGCYCGCGCGEDQMKQCFGDANVNDDNDEDFKTCAVKNPTYPGDDGLVLQKLPGCNPIQAGPQDATVASGPGCVATPATSAPAQGIQPASGSAPVSAPASATASASYGVSSQTAAVPVSFSAVYPSANPSKSAKATLASVANKQDAPNPSSPVNASGKPYGSTPANSQGGKQATGSPSQPAGTQVTTSPANATGYPAAHPSQSADGKEGCKAPVYVTVTPTVYVTKAKVQAATTCAADAVTKTVTSVTTVTVEA